jgi:hypothetical protein
MTSYAVCGGSKKELLWSGLIGRLSSRYWPAHDKAPTVESLFECAATRPSGDCGPYGTSWNRFVFWGTGWHPKRNARAHDFIHTFCRRDDVDGCAVVGTA